MNAGVAVRSAAPLPPGLGFVLSERTRRSRDGRTLVAGGRVLRLSERAVALVAGAPRSVGEDPDLARLARRLLDAGAADPWWPTPPPPDAEVVDVTVVVPVHDRPVALARLLASLPPHLPVVVVDDGSLDSGSTRTVARRYGAAYVAHGTNRGPAAARNTGLRAVRTPWVAFCDSDVRPVPGWLGTLRRHGEDPALAVVAPRVLGPEEDPGDGWVARYEQARSSLDLGPAPAAVRVHGAVAYLPSACLLARVEALGAGFDTALRSGEDVDLVWRLLGQGWRVRYEPAATVRHEHRGRTWSWLARKAFYGTSAAPLAQRHAGAVAPVVLSPWTTALTVALLAQRRWSLPAAAGICLAATATIARRLGPPRPWPAAVTLVAEGAVASVWQAAAALNRHWWPLAWAGAVRSPRIRRAVLVAAVADAVADHRRVRARLPLPAYAVLRRLDDLGYGAGLWAGAVRARSAGALLPRLSGPSGPCVQGLEPRSRRAGRRWRRRLP